MIKRFLKFISWQDDCWEWSGGKAKCYGVWKINGKMMLVHRWAYEAFVGPIPDGYLVCHSCDNRSCVNPKHLFAGTHKDNSQDMVFKGRHRGNQKITKSDVKYIRRTGMSAQDIQEKYGLKKSQAYRIINRKTWQHV